MGSNIKKHPIYVGYLTLDEMFLQMNGLVHIMTKPHRFVCQ